MTNKVKIDWIKSNFDQLISHNVDSESIKWLIELDLIELSLITTN